MNLKLFIEFTLTHSLKNKWNKNHVFMYAEEKCNRIENSIFSKNCILNKCMEILNMYN